MSELEADREQVIQTLCTHFAHDNLNTQELELRFEHAYQAQTSADKAWPTYSDDTDWRRTGSAEYAGTAR